MSNSFFGQPGAPQSIVRPTAAPDLDASADAALAEMDAEDERSSEVKYRMSKANAYLSILDNPLFPENATEAQIEVEAEIREFANYKMEVFLGMQRESSRGASTTVVQQVAELPFDGQQVQALTLWANKLLKRESEAPPLVQRATPSQATPQTAPIVRGEQPRVSAPPPVTQRAPEPQATPQAPRRRPGRPPGTGKNQRAAATPVQKTESPAQTETPPVLPPNVVKDPVDGKLYQIVEIIQNGEVVQKRVAYQVPVTSLVSKAAPTPPTTPADQDAPVQAVTQMRMSGPPLAPTAANQQIAQALESAKSLFMR
jgi:hypothetical protein